MTDEQKQALIKKWIEEYENNEKSLRTKIQNVFINIIGVLTFPLWIIPVIIIIVSEYKAHKNDRKT